MRVILRRVIFALSLSVAIHSRGVAQVTVALGVGSGVRPGMLVFAGPGLDSVRKIVDRDLYNCGCFEMQILSDSASRLTAALDIAAMPRTRNVWVVELQPAGENVQVRLYNLETGDKKQEQNYLVERAGVGDGRLSIHRISDRVVNWVTNGVGISATRILFKQDRPGDEGLYRVDYDGQNRVKVARALPLSQSPAWARDGEHIAYSEYQDARWSVYIQTLASGARVRIIPRNEDRGASYISPAFSPDQKTLLLTRTGEGSQGEILRADISSLAGICCLEPVTFVGNRATNVAPVFSPDGRSIAYESSLRAGGFSQIYRMDADGTGAAPLVSAGAGGQSHAPSWSPDGTKIAFELEDGNKVAQIAVYDLTTGQVKVHTSGSQNMAPSWAPDSRHLIFRTTRYGRNVRLAVLDISGASLTRQIETPGGDARYPAWSPTLGGSIP